MYRIFLSMPSIKPLHHDFNLNKFIKTNYLYNHYYMFYIKMQIIPFEIKVSLITVVSIEVCNSGFKLYVFFIHLVRYNYWLRI